MIDDLKIMYVCSPTFEGITDEVNKKTHALGLSVIDVQIIYDGTMVNAYIKYRQDERV